MTEGVSIVICCYNSKDRLHETLRHISLQKVPDRFNWEVILIDNASTDGTSEEAKKLWTEFGKPAELRILKQPVAGLTASRQMGIENSFYDFILFCDDDNWLDENYLKTGIEIMKGNNQIGLAGGISEPVFENEPPFWFQKYKRSYSIGKQSEKSGDITDTENILWGAGMFVRKQSLVDLFSEGFKPLLPDRTGSNLSSGGDTEICYAVSMSGWKIWYDERLKLKHYIPAHRMSWSYLRKLHRGFGAQKIDFVPYQIIRQKNNHSENWMNQSIKLISKIRGYGFRNLVIYFKKENDGNDDVLRIEKSIGKLAELLKIRNNFSKRINEVQNANWRKGKWR